MTNRPVIFAFATKGSGTNEEDRLRALLSGHDVTFLPFDKRRKRASGWSAFKTIMHQRPDLVVMEGTGLAGGLACLAGKLLGGVRYVVSSGDAVGPFVAAIRPLLGPLFNVYERRLCRHSSGYIGWTPYLVGRALTLGAPCGVTAAGWAAAVIPADRPAARQRIRGQLGIGDETVVVGIVGSLLWNNRYGYCYGSELVKAIQQLPATADVVVVICGGGSGFDRLKQIAGDRLGRQVHLVGEIPAERAADYWAAFDIASLPQSVDQVGSFRYTTKLSEILAARVPVVTGGVPLAYDLDDGWLWRLPGRQPWCTTYVDAMAAFLDRVRPSDVAEKAARIPERSAEFDRERQVRRVTAFIGDLLLRPAGRPAAAPAALERSMADAPPERDLGSFTC